MKDPATTIATLVAIFGQLSDLTGCVHDAEIAESIAKVDAYRHCGGGKCAHGNAERILHLAFGYVLGMLVHEGRSPCTSECATRVFFRKPLRRPAFSSHLLGVTRFRYSA